MRRASIRLLLALAGTALLAAIGCDSANSAEATAPADDGRLLITGSSTLAPVLSEIGRRFEAERPGVRVDIQTGGSSRGINDAAQGLADLGMSSRALRDDEQATTHVIAQDGVAFVIHRDNPVRAIDDQTLRRIYTGGVTNWADAGGPDAPITVIGRADGRSELDLVTAYFGVDAAAMDVTLIAGETQQALKQVAGDPNAIVYVSVGSAVYERERGAPIELLPLRGVPAVLETVADGRFPLARPLLLIEGADLGPTARAFIAYARSKAVHDLIETNAFVPVR